MLIRSGRFSRTVGAGRHVVPPWIVVSHVVTVREIPFETLAVGQPTLDDVRIDMDVLLTFTIVAPERFVFAISAPDFDLVCQAAALGAVRELVRGKHSADILDVTSVDTDELQARIGEAIAPYGVEVQRVVITHVRPPDAFMATREARRLASAQRDEQTEIFALQERRQADAETLTQQRVAAQRERIELEAANETLRLRNLEQRLADYPAAARRDVLDRRIAVAEALAGNTRAMVQVGQGGDVADTLILHTMTDDQPSDTARGAGGAPKRQAPPRTKPPAG
jgi:regulator of protease activity HflC (stomatin/prohibitin superfamily)